MGIHKDTGTDSDRTPVVSSERNVGTCEPDVGRVWADDLQAGGDPVWRMHSLSSVPLCLSQVAQKAEERSGWEEEEERGVMMMDWVVIG